jgi:hypothetical protein
MTPYGSGTYRVASPGKYACSHASECGNKAEYTARDNRAAVAHLCMDCYAKLPAAEKKLYYSANEPLSET